MQSCTSTQIQTIQNQAQTVTIPASWQQRSRRLLLRRPRRRKPCRHSRRSRNPDRYGYRPTNFLFNRPKTHQSRQKRSGDAGRASLFQPV